MEATFQEIKNMNERKTPKTRIAIRALFMLLPAFVFFFALAAFILYDKISVGSYKVLFRTAATVFPLK